MKTRLLMGAGFMLVSVLAAALVFSQDTPERNTITLEKTVHFLSPDGSEAVIAPGTYTAKPEGEKAIQLTAKDGGTTATIQAEAGAHEQQVSVPESVVVASDEDVVHIVMLMQGGTTLDAIGTLSGVRTRGPLMIPLPPQQLAGAMPMQPVPGTPMPGPVPGVDPMTGIPQVGQLPQKLQTQPGSELQKAVIGNPEQKKLLTNPPLGSGCNVGPDGKLLTADKFVDIKLVAKAARPFSVELSWSGPPVQYEVTGTMGAGGPIYINAPDQQANLAIKGTQSQQQMAPQPGQRVPLGGQAFTPPDQSQTATYTFRHERPGFPVLPDFQYEYKIKATSPDGKIICQEVRVKTLPAPITPLQSVFVNPTEIRLGFLRPQHAQEVSVYRRDYVEDGRQPPFNKRVLQEIQPSSSNIRQINPGLPPLPSNYNQAIVYNFVVEAIWRDSFGRSSTAQLPIQVSGPLPLWGWADLHTHPMSNLAFGGKIFHGGPDVGSLLPAVDVPKQGFDVDARPVCLPDHRARNMEEALGSDSPTHGDSTQSRCGDSIRKSAIWFLEGAKGPNGQPGNRLGAPTFSAWPKWNDITHQKMWWQWIKRAHEGGLRVLVALSHNNRLLGDVVSVNKQLTCAKAPITCVTSDRLSSDLQIKEMKDFVGRHSDFMEVARSAADVYRIVRGNPPTIPSKIAVVLGIEIDNIGDFNQLPLGALQPGIIAAELQRLYDQDVRYIFPIHVVDNVFGDTAPYEELFNAANFFETGQLWKFGCANSEDEIGFHAPINVQLDKPFSDFIKLPAALQAPICSPDFGHRNSRTLPTASNPLGGLTPLGEFAVREMMKKGMIIDIDHMSHQAVERTLQIAESIPGGGYPLMSGHNGIRDRNTPFNVENNRTRAQLDRIGCLGGMFGLGTDHAEARNWAAQYQDALGTIRMRAARCLHKELGLGAVAFGTDTNSLVGGPKPLQEGSDLNDRNLNVYGRANDGTCRRFPCDPAPKIGPQVWDIRTDGVAHFGMFADFVKAVWTFPLDHNRKMHMSGQNLVENHLDRNADNFWRMWLKVEAQKNKVQ